LYLLAFVAIFLIGKYCPDNSAYWGLQKYASEYKWQRRQMVSTSNIHISICRVLIALCLKHVLINAEIPYNTGLGCNVPF